MAVGIYQIKVSSDGNTNNNAVSEIVIGTLNITSRTSGGGGSTSINPPTASQKPGEVVKDSIVSLSTTYANGKIYYTTDGSMPTVNSTLYTKPIIIDKDMTLKVIVVSGSRSSSVAALAYTVRAAKITLKTNAQTSRYIKGRTDKQFEPDAAITRYEMIEGLALLFDIEKVDTAKVFSDVDETYKDLVQLFAGAGVIDGFPDGTFGGEKGLTRAEFVKIMSIVLGLDIQDGKSAFSDMDEHWAEKYVAEFEKSDYLKGYPDGTFQPDTQMTRAEFVAIVNRIIGIQKVSVPSVFEDLQSEHWAYGDVMAVYMK